MALSHNGRVSTFQLSPRELLTEVLSEIQYTQMVMWGFFQLHSPRYADRMYEVHPVEQLVHVFEGGEHLLDLSFEFTSLLLAEDFAVLAKILIESNEQACWLVAQRHPVVSLQSPRFSR